MPLRRHPFPPPKPTSVFLILGAERRFFEISTTDLTQDEWGRVSTNEGSPNSWSPGGLRKLEGDQGSIGVHGTTKRGSVARFAEYRADNPDVQELLASQLEGKSIAIDGFHTAIFGYYVLWLQNKPLLPFQDLSVSMSSNRLSKHVPDNQPAAYRPDVTMEKLADTRYDNNPVAMSTARKLFAAYFMGQDLQTPYFQDAIMNTIIQLFRPNQPIPPSLVEEVYRRANPGLAGFKKFLVDYYIWACIPPSKSALPRLCMSSGLLKSSIPPLSRYPEAFRTGVTITHQNIHKQITAETNPLSRPREKQYKDTEIDFSNLDMFLRNGKGGMLRCRYHQHTHVDLCFNLMV